MIKFETTEVDYLIDRDTPFSFEFKGVSDKSQLLTLKPSCGCTTVNNIRVNAQEPFTIKGNITGRKINGVKKVIVNEHTDNIQLFIKYTIK